VADVIALLDAAFTKTGGVQRKTMNPAALDEALRRARIQATSKRRRDRLMTA
jgi:hypothetical protein